jgi:Major Vault Protein repeat domain
VVTVHFLGTYIPRKEVEIVQTVLAKVVKADQALRLRARKEFVDRNGCTRVAGEEWMEKKIGAYMPGAYEEIVDIVSGYVLTDKVNNYNSYLLLVADCIKFSNVHILAKKFD